MDKIFAGCFADMPDHLEALFKPEPLPNPLPKRAARF